MGPLTAGRQSTTRLIPVDSLPLAAQVAGWLAAPENFQWLDFGFGRERITPALVMMMARHEANVLRVFTADDVPIGVTGFNNIVHAFRTATIWTVLGDKAYARRGRTTVAVSKMLTLGFTELGLRAINTWVVDGNPSLVIANRLRFHYIGRQRQCHDIDGRPRDRLFFDLLLEEHRELCDE